MSGTSDNSEIGYVFVDIVAFTKEYKSSKEQCDAVRTMNEEIRKIIEQERHAFQSVTYLPTGDGMCICFRPMASAESSRVICTIGQKICNELRGRVPVRVGVNQGCDTELRDIRDEENFVGAGINDCSRIMGFASKSQLLIGDTVIQRLLGADQTQGDFCGRTLKYVAADKHRNKIIFHALEDADPPEGLCDPGGYCGFFGNFLRKSGLHEGVQTTAIRSSDKFLTVLESKGIVLVNNRFFLKRAFELLGSARVHSEAITEFLKGEGIRGDASFLAYEALAERLCAGESPESLSRVLSSFRDNGHFRPSPDCEFLINILFSLCHLLRGGREQAHQRFKDARVFDRIERGLNEFDLYVAPSIVVLALKFRDNNCVLEYLELMRTCKNHRQYNAYPFTFLYEKYYLLLTALIADGPLHFALRPDDVRSTPLYSKLFGMLLGVLATDSDGDLVFLYDAIGKRMGQEYSDGEKNWRSRELRTRLKLIGKRIFERYLAP
jgi:class 3 adenylate cyclase